mmetsp:Transcript_44347/g.119406  ORF Transcript_44347/g.119406 Transcript_44347/m.119406 type:complete len:244 (-) Transcript_44347:57-788(-)
MGLEHLHQFHQLVGNVQPVRVERQQHQVRPLGQPGADRVKIVAPAPAVLGARKHARGVYEGDSAQEVHGHHQRLEAAEETPPEAGQARVGQLRQAARGVALHHLLLVPVDHSHELVGAGLGAHVEVGAAALREPLDHRSLARAVLPDEQHLWVRQELRLRHRLVVEVPEMRLRLDRQHDLLVQFPELPHHLLLRGVFRGVLRQRLARVAGRGRGWRDGLGGRGGSPGHLRHGSSVWILRGHGA